MNTPDTALPLEGLRVVDFTRLLPGPYATLVLADLGAEVFKIEPPEGGDYVRWMPPLAGAVSSAFAALNTGKRSVAVDLKHPECVAWVRRLCLGADVVIESFRPGVMDRLGLGYPSLAAEHPGLIYCAISGYGQDGPYRDRAGHDLNYIALAGVLGLAGPPDAAPTLPPVQIADVGGGGLQALVGILVALHARNASGRGRFIDASMTDGALSFLQMAMAGALGGGASPPARGADTLTGGQPCYGVYETQDGGFMSLAALEPKFWKAFCEAVERPDLLGSQFGGPAQSERTRAEIAAIFGGRPRAEWEAIFAATDACCEPVLRPDELADHPLHAARQATIEDAAGHVRLRTPLRPRDAAPPAPAPALGADTRAVLRELGCDEATLERLAAAKAIAG
ncbi:MAG: CoA transferase [Deltaproteobacteria bacterium]|nr:CoA transferase [Deltaproteobacteria bacterium]MCB9785963.1 CoA transferase [Deltaproteobacteria bacterium]